MDAMKEEVKRGGGINWEGKGGRDKQHARCLKKTYEMLVYKHMCNIFVYIFNGIRLHGVIMTPHPPRSLDNIRNLPTPGWETFF